MKAIPALIVVWLAAVTGVYAFGGENQEFLKVAVNLIAPTAAAFPAAYSILLLKEYGFNPRQRYARAWFYASIGLLLWFLGESTWSIYTLILSVDIPYPSLADVFWLAGYVLIIAFSVAYVMPFAKTLSTKDIVGITAATGVVALVVYLVLIGPVVSLEGEPLTQLFDFAYPFLDLVLLGMSVAGLLVFLGGKLSRFWVWLNMGFILFVIADVLFSYTTSLGLYYDGHPLELFYHFGDALVLLGLYFHRQTL